MGLIAKYQGCRKNAVDNGTSAIRYRCEVAIGACDLALALNLAVYDVSHHYELPNSERNGL